MVRQKVLLLGSIVHAHEEWNKLAALADVVQLTASSRAEFIDQCQDGTFNGVVAIYRTHQSGAIIGTFDEELVNALPHNIKFISQRSAGYEAVDVAACSKRGIRVSNVPSVVDGATSDTALFLILGALRGFNQPMMALRAGEWRGQPAPPLGHDPKGKVLGILGCGGIGREIARKAAVLGMTSIYHNRSKSSAVTEAEYVSFATLLSTSDVIAVSLPLNSHTHHIISHKEFAQMKDGVVVINTARGPVIDEQALVDALQSEKVWSSGLDVFENEPTVHPGLIEHPRSVLLPHLGTYTVETSKEMEERNIANVRAVIETGDLLDIVPEQR